MPVIEIARSVRPYVVYDAPINEKTVEIRRKFKVDESGYPEEYKWRGLAKLGDEYQPEDPFLKFAPCEEKELLSWKVTVIGLSAVMAFAYQAGLAKFLSRPLWSRPWNFLGAFTVLSVTSLYVQKVALRRQAYKDAIYIDYLRLHPERFGPIKRYKFRETLFGHLPIR